MQLLSALKVRFPSKLDQIVRNDATGGIIMLFCTVLALILQNGSYSTSYRHWLETQAGVIFGDFSLIKPLLLWINDGLITIFFFSIGLELKIEFIKGHLSNPRNIILPSLAAVGGIVAPSLVFMLFNYGDEFAMRGWAIPTATDTAFSVALILLLGSRVPSSLKIFLLSMAIFDDIGAIIVIAVFYTADLSTQALIATSFAIVCLLLLNFFGVARKLFYLFFGVILWFSIFKSGVHATLAGIITAFCIPMQDARGRLMVEPIFDNLKMWVALLVLPVFTIANAGIDLSLINITDFFSPVSLGIFCGLFFGKQLGIFGVVMLCIKLHIVKMPSDVNVKQIYGVCILTGIGFSMSMFIDSLAYQGSNVFNYSDSLAILLASLCSGVYGYLFLRFVACRTLAIEYRPWLPAPEGYKGGAMTANVYALEKNVEGPSSVAPTAAAVAAANQRAAAAAQAAAAASEAAKAAAVAAEAVKQIAEEGIADEQKVVQIKVAAAQAAAAAAEAAVSSSQIHEDEISQETAETAAAVLDVAQAAAEVAQEEALEVAEAVAEAEAEAEQAENKSEEEQDSEDKDTEAVESDSMESESKAKEQDSEAKDSAATESEATQESDKSADAKAQAEVVEYAVTKEADATSAQTKANDSATKATKAEAEGSKDSKEVDAKNKGSESKSAKESKESKDSKEAKAEKAAKESKSKEPLVNVSGITNRATKAATSLMSAIKSKVIDDSKGEDDEARAYAEAKAHAQTTIHTRIEIKLSKADKLAQAEALAKQQQAKAAQAAEQDTELGLTVAQVFGEDSAEAKPVEQSTEVVQSEVKLSLDEVMSKEEQAAHSIGLSSSEASAGEQAPDSKVASQSESKDQEQDQGLTVAQIFGEDSVEAKLHEQNSEAVHSEVKLSLDEVMSKQEQVAHAITPASNEDEAREADENVTKESDAQMSETQVSDFPISETPLAESQETFDPKTQKPVTWETSSSEAKETEPVASESKTPEATDVKGKQASEPESCDPESQETLDPKTKSKVKGKVDELTVECVLSQSLAQDVTDLAKSKDKPRI